MDGAGGVASVSQKKSILRDQRGAVALETIIVYIFMVTSLLLPLADLAAAGFQYISAWAALRSFGQYVQYNTPPDPTSTTTWKSTLPNTVGGYNITNVNVVCGDGNTGCTDATLTPKYYTYATTVTLAPMMLTSMLCTSGNANPCSFTLSSSERFQ